MKAVIWAIRKSFFLLLAFILSVPQLALALTADQVYERVKKSVVVVKTYDRAGKIVGLGSGVVLPSGNIVTNYHVVKAGVRYTVGQLGKAAPAFLQGNDPEKDLALLVAPSLTGTPARLGQASRIKVGERVYAVGAPQGLELSLSEGIVSQLRGGLPPIIQTSVAISQGSSGGGLFNAQGELVGIMTFYLEGGQSLNFALPVEWVREVATAPAPDRGPIIGENGPAVPAPAKKSTGRWLDMAMALDRAKDWQGLLAHSRQWTMADPGDSESWTYLAVAFEELGQYQEAISAYRELLRLKPDDAYAWGNLGFVYSKLGRYQDEIEAYREALRLKPTLSYVWFVLGVAYGKLGHYQDEIKAYREALRLKPDDPKVLTNLALVYAQIGNRSAAMDAVKELRRYDSKQADELYSLIMIMIMIMRP